MKTYAVILILAVANTSALMAAVQPIRADRPYAIDFPAQEAKFVRLVIHSTNGAQPCVDEMEVYGPDGKKNLALVTAGGKASASSCYPSNASHTIEHLNDGRYGNRYSWIPGSHPPSWAQIELSRPVMVCKVVISRDRERRYNDRVPTKFEIRLSNDGQKWKTVKKLEPKVEPSATIRQPHGAGNPVPGPPAPPRFNVPGEKTASPSGGNVVQQKDKLGLANLALGRNAKAAASSAISGYEIHKVANLNDARSGNNHSWVAKTNPAWAEIDLGGEYWVHRVAFGSDSSGEYHDRAPTRFKILTARKHDSDSATDTWKTAYKREGGLTVKRRAEFTFKPVRARWVRVLIEGTNNDSARIDELEIFGQKDEIPLAKLDPASFAPARPEIPEQALMGEEHAWLKTYGRADLSPRLVPYNGRVKEYPRRVGNDRLPLGEIAEEPKFDGKLDDACWKTASRGVGRVVWPFDYDTGPLIETAVWAATKKGSELFLAIETNRLLSGHLAVISDGQEGGRGVLALTADGIVFRQYAAGNKLKNELLLKAGFNPERTRCEVSLPLSLFPQWKEKGLLVRTGMGGKHTSHMGHAMAFVPSPLAMAEVAPCRGGKFQVQFTLPAGAKPITLSADPLSARPASPSLPAPPPAPLPAVLTEGLTITPGESRVVSIPIKPGPIGPECKLTVNTKSDGQSAGSFTLNLFRYDPLQRTLTLFDEMIARSAAKGMDVSAERRRLAELAKLQTKLQTAQTPDLAAERQAYREARIAKRRLFFRDADLEPIEKLLFVKRHAFEPSHNYSVNLDSRWRSGGAVCSIEIPREDGRFQPGKAKVNELFKTKKGIARTPMATFDAGQIYFGYRPSKPEYYHIMRMNADGSEVEQLTDGPFHDYWPCPLPDGGLAFITTRCKCRFLCWRPQAAVMFRMDADGANMQPLSFANLSEWAPSVMSDGRIIWTRSEYVDKAADFSHTLWTVRPDGTKPELIFGNTIIQPNGYANGRQVPGTKEICCTLISHFGDLNGPIALVDIDKGRFNQKAIKSITPEVPWPGSWPREECFRDAVPLSKDFFLCSHSPRYQFGLYVIDRHGNREPLYFDDTYGCMCPTPLRAVAPPPALRRIEGRIAEKGESVGDVLASLQSKPKQPKPFAVLPNVTARSDSKQCQIPQCGIDDNNSNPQEERLGTFAMADVYQGIDHIVPRGSVKYVRVCAEVRSPLEQLENGEYRQDHEPFMHYYAGPVDVVSGPSGWPSYVAKASLGLAPVEEDGSAHFMAPAGKQLYLQILDKDFNELQRMRSVVQLQPAEQRSCVGCHEDRRRAPPVRPGIALRRRPDRLQEPPWGTAALDYQDVVQPVLTAKCVSCHGAKDNHGLDLSGRLDKNRIPMSYKTLISQGWVHHFDYGWNSGGNEKAQPMSFGSLKSRLWKVLDAGHYDVQLSTEEMRRIKVWIDLNCPLWPDYKLRDNRPLAKVGSK